MKQIEIEDDLYKYILANIEEFGETPSQILRRLLVLPATDNESCKETGPTDKGAEAVTIAHQSTPSLAQSDNAAVECVSLPKSLAHGIAALFSDPAFKKETIVTNKFKMMLTAMYHENKKAFISAAHKTKGRKRDYLGQHLSALLASENAEEVAQLKASKPREIPYTPFWVVTNANTGRKRIILTKMMTAMGYSQALIEQIKDEI